MNNTVYCSFELEDVRELVQFISDNFYCENNLEEQVGTITVWMELRNAIKRKEAELRGC